MMDTANLEKIIAHLQEVQYGLESGRREITRQNLIKATSSLTADMSGHALDRGFTDRPGITVLDRQLELVSLWQAWTAGDAKAKIAFASELGIILTRLQAIVAEFPSKS